MKKMTAVIDRIEMGIATVIPDDGSPLFTCPLPDGFFEGQTIVLENGTVRPADESEIPNRNNKDRLKNLFNKSKRSN